MPWNQTYFQLDFQLNDNFVELASTLNVIQILKMIEATMKY